MTTAKVSWSLPVDTGFCWLMSDEHSENQLLTEEDNNTSKTPSNGQTLLSGKLLHADQVLKLLTSSNSNTILQGITYGIKENTYFVVDNAKNVERRVNSQYSQFVH